MRFDAATADCRVCTYKEGLLSAVAHDLEIAVTAFAIEVDEDAWRVEARFDPTSLRVVGAARSGVVDPAVLSESDKRTIEGHIAADVLDAARYPEIRFVSRQATARGDELAIAGTLTLHGRSRDLAVTARRDAGGWTAAARLHQPDFGIRPYTAMLGTLRVRADVAVRVTIRQ
ncbi:MAG: YceI family protein [Myxococcales bacterium]|jgi:polyisoprenoid-binding protein YceI|nr:YceI family protein [Myxococcales bacterium]